MADIELQNELDRAMDSPSTGTVSVAATLAKEGNDLTSQIVATNDTNKLNDLTKQFELNRRKKDIVRANKLSNLLTMIDDEIVDRMATTPELIKDQDLVKYMQSAQEAISVGEQAGTQITQININQGTNISLDAGTTLNRDSRKKVLDTVNEILRGLNNETDTIDVEAIKKEEN